MSPTPPVLAEAVLRSVLKRRDVESVPGDLLEEYRDRIWPARGKGGADVWYVRQVLGFVSRGASSWAVLFAMAFVTRTALDWFAPTLDFSTRSTVSTMMGIGIQVTAGLYVSFRSGSCVGGTVAGIAATVMAAVISAFCAAALLIVWHDTQTMAAIRQSGGIGEVFALPVMMIVPGAVLGTLGGVIGSTINRHHDPPCPAASRAGARR
jgi:hypothetical protein